MNLYEEKEKTQKGLAIIANILNKVWGTTSLFCSDGTSVEVESLGIKATYCVVDRKIYSYWKIDDEIIEDIHGETLKDFIKYYPSIRKEGEFMPLQKLYGFGRSETDWLENISKYE